MYARVNAAKDALDAAITAKSPSVEGLRQAYETERSSLSAFLDKVQTGKTEASNTFRRSRPALKLIPATMPR
jgi:hypothetical protein